MIIRRNEITYYDENGIFAEHDGKEYYIQYGKYTVEDIRNLTSLDVLEVFKKGRKYVLVNIERR